MERLLAQVKVLHCQTVREQEAQSKGDAARHGLEQPSARDPVRNASEHDSARQAGETLRSTISVFPMSKLQPRASPPAHEPLPEGSKLVHRVISRRHTARRLPGPLTDFQDGPSRTGGYDEHI